MMCWPLWQKPQPDEWQVYMLDVGQGVAMVIARNGKAILYDTGLAWPEGDSGQQIIIPWLRWHNLEPEGVILSHEHLIIGEDWTRYYVPGRRYGSEAL